MGHEHQDTVRLELARRIAPGLLDHSEWLDLTRYTLDTYVRTVWFIVLA